MPLKLLKPERVAPGQSKLRMGIIGPQKVGKTWLAATAEHDPRTAPVLILSVEGGLSGIETLPEPRPFAVEVVRPSMDADEPATKKNRPLHIMTDAFIDIAQEVAQAEREGREPEYRTVVIDTYSELYEAELQWIAKNRAGASLLQSEETYSMYDYVQANRSMRDVVKMFRNLPLHVIVTCHSKVVEIVKGDKVVGTRVGIGVSEGSEKPFVRLMDQLAFYTFRTRADKETGESRTLRVLHTIPSGDYTGVSGARGLGANIGDLVSPTMTDILDAMYGPLAQG